MKSGSRVVRGGNFELPPEDPRCARRLERGVALDANGLRPARRVISGAE